MRDERIVRITCGLLVVFAVLLATPAAAQEQVTVTGVVTAREDGAPQVGATVVVDKTGASTLTDEQGRYTLSVPPGTHTVEVHAFGHVPTTQTVVAQAGQTQTLDMQVDVDPRLSEVIVVVGSRTPRTQLETSVPVDVITSEVISESSHTETNQMLNAVTPSFNASHLSVVDGTDHIDPASLRGLGPEHVLVLVNGKRRQQSALVNFYNGGTVGVDLNAIPTSAIARIEVLRDGAASQYGSDAIAGVINIVLKDDVDTVDAYAMSGITASGDGEQLKVGANGGLKLGSRGFVNVTGEFLARGRTNRSKAWPGDIFVDEDGMPLDAQETEAELMRRGLTRDDFSMSVGQSGALVGTSFLNAAYPLNSTFEVYGHGGYTYRKGKASGFRRFPDDPERNTPMIHPDGFLPEINPTLNAWSVTAGTRAKQGAWEGDLSLTHGGDAFHFFVDNSLNASLGDASPTHFDAGTLAFNQTTANLDMVQHLDVGLPALSLVAGGEYRHENYSITAGQDESWEAGPVTVDGTPDGPPKAPGAQVFPGFRPDDETDSTRDSEAVYLGAESRPIDQMNLDVGGRFEHYSDFGSTVIGKVAGRFALWKTEENEVALRGSISTGFRAPALQQIWYSTIATNFINDPVTGQFTPSEILVSPNRDPVTEAFGIPRLKEETSVNVSGGFTARLMNNLSVSADYYRIRIEDRVVLSGLFGSDDETIGAPVADILDDFPGVNGAQFYVNAVDTTTNGLDVVVDYTYPLPNGSISANASANFTKTTVDDVRVPDSVQEKFDDVGPDGPERVREIFLGRDGENRLEDLLPRRKGTFGVGYDYDRLSTGVRANYFGPTIFRSAFTDADGNFLDEAFGSEVTFDVNVGYRIGDLRLNIGGNNVFNNFPDEQRRPDNRFFDSFIYGAVTPYGIEGGFYYVRLEYVL